MGTLNIEYIHGERNERTYVERVIVTHPEYPTARGEIHHYGNGNYGYVVFDGDRWSNSLSNDHTLYDAVGLIVTVFMKVEN